ncbi:polygalacturonase-like [Silene latifolia]|uniref:polygalacturonase-like n=1 Tax=Silene latifolia TaxID=37657 RepID=UPI003D783116
MTFSVNSGYATKMYNVLKFGAKPNGKADTTKAFLKSWKAACNTKGPAVIDVPKGRYVLKPLMFKGKKCISKNITLNIKGSLIAPKDHHILGKVENWITFNEVTGVSIIGGILDGRGPTWWRCKESGGNCLMGATSLRIVYSNNISIRGLTSLNSQEFHIAITGCQNVHIEGVDVIASADSPNTDGIHVQSSTHVTIIDSTMRTGDDCISIGPGVKNVHIEDVLCGPGHGISIGSLGWEKKEAGVQNVTVKSVVISNTTNGLRIKSWARPSTGFVQTILYENVTFRNVENPIIVDQYYCPNNQCPRQESGIKISNVTYKEIRGTSSTEVAMTFNCSTLSPCSGIKLENVNITFLDQEAQSTCNNVQGQAIGMVQPKSCF